jgi:hypothetical protein
MLPLKVPRGVSRFSLRKSTPIIGHAYFDHPGLGVIRVAG